MGHNDPPRFTAPDRLALAICIAALLFLIAGGSLQIRRPTLDISALQPVDPREPALQGTGFAPNAVYYSTPPPPHRGSLAFYGSLLSSPAPAASVYSPWYPAPPRFALYISGYLNTPGNSLFIEYTTPASPIESLQIPPELVPGESWWVREVAFPRGSKPLRFRIHAAAASTSSQGWLGFSGPFLIQQTDHWATAKQLLMIPLLLSAAFAAFLAPGLFLRARWPNLGFIWIPVPGILLSALLGLLAWFGPHAIKPRWIARAGLAIVLVTACYAFTRIPLSRLACPLERRVLLIVLLLACLGVAKSTYSLGPAGELYAARISRTLEPGGRADSRISYHGVQLIALRAAPHSPLAMNFYYPWDFSSRGPIASLAVAPLVLSSSVQVEQAFPDGPWQPFDSRGFAAFRISMIVLAACALIPVFGLAAYLLPRDWAFFAFLVAATAPFIVHEVYFTWPKLLSAALVLLAAYLALRENYFWAGLLIGLGYLAHPSALLWLPAVAALAFLSRPRRSLPRTAWQMAALALGTALWLLLWRYLNRGHFAQDFFLSYVSMTAGRTPSLPNWLLSRLDSALNTLLPFNLFLFHRDTGEISSIYRSSPPLIRFFFQYWNTLPFAVGILFFFSYFLRAFWLALKRTFAYLSLVFAVPLAIFIVYWGMSSAGLAREGLHAWILGLLIATIAIWRKFPPASQTLWRFCNWALAFRGVEILLMLLLPTLASNPMLVQTQFAVTDIASLISMLAIVAFLALCLFRSAEQMRITSAAGPKHAFS
ncbi:MAG: hypothetical protein JO340_18645 [Acidobacteriaceae bacterium]|nr:hypothetical protein [Acidobacteriaceae bacterium]